MSQRERSASNVGDEGEVTMAPASSAKKRRDRALSGASLQSGSVLGMNYNWNEKVNIIEEGKGFATFEIIAEDHTLGNVVRFAAMQDPKVHVAAYVVPHPLESKMQLRVETVKEDGNPTVALTDALNKVIGTCDTFSDRFESRLKSFKKKQKDAKMET